MKGWKTWLAVAVSLLYGIGGFIAGLHGSGEMAEFVVAALGLVGIGHKIEKGIDSHAQAKNAALDDIVRDHQSG